MLRRQRPTPILPFLPFPFLSLPFLSFPFFSFPLLSFLSFFSFLSFRSSCLKWKMGDYKYLKYSGHDCERLSYHFFRASRRRFLLLGNSSVRSVRSGQTKYAESDSFQFLPSSVHWSSFPSYAKKPDTHNISTHLRVSPLLDWDFRVVGRNRKVLGILIIMLTDTAPRGKALRSRRWRLETLLQYK